MIKTRFAPSPTGMIHIGNARAALFSAMFAKKNKGIFLLRIEDTDAARSEEQFTAMLQHDLNWLGIYWQEGPGVGGDLGPYLQSLRQDVYEKYYQILEEKKLIYPCFCSDQELRLARKVQLSSSQAPRYSGKCLKLSDADIQKKMADGGKPAWRIKIPAAKTIEFVDLVKGPQSFMSDDIGDFIVRRADGTSPFLFCNAIDDSEMKVTHILRGEDHISNTPRQLIIMQALGLHEPAYGHLSLITGEDGAPLSKRHGSFSLEQLKDHGYLPEAIINYLVRLGHTCDAQGLLNFEELSSHFRMEGLGVSPARFDLTQLMYWQKNAIQALDEVSLSRWLGEKILNQVPLDQQSLFLETIKSNIEFPADALEWGSIFFHELVKLDADDAKVIHDAGEQFFVEAEQAVDKYGDDIKQVLEEMKNTLNVSGKNLFMPIRIALTGRRHGPEMAQIATILGSEKMKRRLSQAFKLASMQMESRNQP